MTALHWLGLLALIGGSLSAAWVAAMALGDIDVLPGRREDYVSRQWLENHLDRLAQGDAPPTPDEVAGACRWFEPRWFRVFRGGWIDRQDGQVFGGIVLKEGRL